MQSPPPFLLVQLALPPKFQPLFHIHQLVSDFLIPDTIDGAVYNELPRVMKMYEAFRPLTVGAMDGAAARGRLDVMQKLQSDRMEGCSSQAFVGAAANGQLEVLWWLNEFYASLAQPADMVRVAAENGHTRLVGFLRGGLSREELESAISAAASNGHVAVVKVLLPRVNKVADAFVVASANGHLPVLQLLVERCDADRVLDVEQALEKAGQCGHRGVVEFLRGVAAKQVIAE